MAFTIAEGCVLLENVKLQQNATLRQQGIDMTGVKFEDYWTKFNTAQEIVEGWIYPSEWPIMPGMPVDQRVYALIKVSPGQPMYSLLCTVATPAPTQYKVNWDFYGDGTTTTHNTNTVAEYTYTDFTQPYKIVEITAVTNGKLTSINFQRCPLSDTRASKGSPLLCIKGNVGNLTAANSFLCYSRTGATFWFNNNLECVELLGTINASTNCFTACGALKKVSVDTINGSWSGLCNTASNLKEFTYRTGVGSVMTSAFSGTAIKRPPILPSTARIFTTCFNNNPLLEDLNGNILTLTTETAVQITAMFAGSMKLKKIEFDMSLATSASVAYSVLYNLEELRLYNCTTTLNNVEVVNAKMDINAITNLFNDLPDRVGLDSGTVKIAGNSGVNDLTPSISEIATNKNWTVITI